MEGSHLLGLMLLLLAAAWLIRERRWWKYLLLGVCTGFAVATKHPNALAAGLVFIACAIVPVCEALGSRFKQWRSPAKALMGLLLAGISALFVFLVLNPAWWHYPLEVRGDYDIAALAIDCIAKGDLGRL